MSSSEWTLYGASLIELLAAAVIVIHIVRALLALVQTQGLTTARLDTARLWVADGVVTALGFSLAASLLKVIGLQQWVQIRTFAAVFVLRTLLKKVFIRERVLIGRRSL